MTNARARAMRLLFILALALGGCGDASPAAAPAVGNAPAAPALRIVSLSPAITRTLADLGLGDAVVGRTRWCGAVDESVAIVGDLDHVDYERLVRLEPTHLLIQPRFGGADQRLIELAEAHGWRVGRWSSIDGRADVERLIRELPAVIYPDDAAASARLEARGAQLITAIALAFEPAPSAWIGRVLLVESASPVTVYGHGTYLDDVLVAVGSTNAAPFTGWGELSLEDVTRLDPEAIVFVRPGASVDLEAAEAAGLVGALDVRAVREGRLAILRHRDALLPSSAIAPVAEELRAIITSFGGPDP